ncbi:glycosyltransferase family 4 protein [Luteolibacter sp. GHJ8]|uniref:Glycosyltransferase family 4 protein n=1 Tax=Luteolibacter rhizosphaerae TaxID=2989719 RepID=A0ABT3FYL2_9BACT|nr:glycosyltransferase family 4 protein [Luteolibacter rhizosphaerae]MCW1912679.1 glycosyltransferase family 4 protein [Luteolibacter rhizosphaerae]
MSERLCVFITGSLQPYAIDFYRAVERSLRARGWRFLVLVGSKSTYRPWAGMGIAEDDPLFSFIPGKPAPEWVQRLLGSGARDKILMPGGSGVTAALEKLSPGILILNERNPLNLRAALWARKRGIPRYLSTDIGRCPPPHAATKGHLVYHRLIAGLFDGVIAKTPEARTAYVKSGAPEAVLAPHGIDTSRFPLPLGPGAEPFRFLFVGVLEAAKGLDTLVAAGRLLHGQGHRFEIRLVGSGSWKPDPADEGSPWLSLAGFREGTDLLAEYHVAGAFVLPSYGDTYGVVVHEAASCGLPVLVSTAAGACETLAIEGRSGFRINPSDPEALAKHMGSLLADSGLSRKLGHGARELAERWCVTRSGEEVAGWLLANSRI